jgi:hypothetical protein
VEAAAYVAWQAEEYRSAEAVVYVSMAGRRNNARSVEAAVYVSMAGGRVSARNGGSGICEHGRQKSNYKEWRQQYMSIAGRKYQWKSGGQQYMCMSTRVHTKCREQWYM